MESGWPRLAGRGALGYAVGVGLDILSLGFTGAGHGEYPYGRMPMAALLPLLALAGAFALLLWLCWPRAPQNE